MDHKLTGQALKRAGPLLPFLGSLVRHYLSPGVLTRVEAMGRGMGKAGMTAGWGDGARELLFRPLASQLR